MRNQMHSFAATPDANIPRSRFNMPCNVKFTGNTGKLIPFYVCEVLPGDTFKVSTSFVARLQTLLHPLMDNLYLDTYYFFVPNRLVWDNWQHFCGEPDRAWVPSREWTIPTIQRMFCFQTEEGYLNKFKGHIVDYMGIGVNVNVDPQGAFSEKINALPIRAYNKIYDDWFRDENLIDPINLYTGDANRDGFSSDANAQDPLVGGIPYDAPKLHDYFTSALPDAQRGNPAMLVTGSNVLSDVITKAASHTPGTAPLTGKLLNSGSNPLDVRVSYNTSSGSYPLAGFTSGPVANGFYPDNLYADLSGINLGISVNDLRMAFQVQKFMERSARGGSRYIEILKSMFGVSSPDARLQRSEYLGGHRVPINIHQVVNQAESAAADLGNTAAFSVTSDVHDDFIHSFVEHGFVIGICTVRYKHTYPQGMDRMWLRRTKFDFYWPVFAHIGEQPIKNYEIYIPSNGEHTANQNLGELPFGYQEAWADYRFKPNRVMGEMRPGVPNTLASWHLADYYTQTPTLSKAWIQEDLAPVDRAIAVQSSAADQFLFDVLVNNNATRPMPLYSIPGLVDHF